MGRNRRSALSWCSFAFSASNRRTRSSAGTRNVEVSRNTQPFNYTGHPALALPVGKSSAGLPISMQLVGRFFDDPLLMRVAHAYQHATDWNKIIGVRA